MKFLKLSLVTASLLIANQSNCNPMSNVKHIAIAITKTSTREGACPEDLKVIANMYKRGPVQPPKAAQTLQNLSIENKGFVLKSLIEYFFDETNKDPLATHIDAFIFFGSKAKQGAKLPQLANFVQKLKGIRLSTNANEIRKTMDSEIKKLAKVLEVKYPQVANKIGHDLKAFFDSKSKSELAKILVSRAAANR